MDSHSKNECVDIVNNEFTGTLKNVSVMSQTCPTEVFRNIENAMFLENSILKHRFFINK